MTQDSKLKHSSATQAALHGIKVLDLSRVLAGPWASQNLADLGADVIKIEHPAKGDDTRGWGPPYWQSEVSDDKMSAYFMSCNRNKKSLAIDISTNEGQSIIHQLVAQSDIVIENFKVDKLKQYGLDYETLKTIKSDIIYCSITGFGQTGPKKDHAGYDLMIQAMSGLMSITGKSDSEPGGGPVKVGVALVDVMTGLYATIGILAAVNHRYNTGEGQYVDMALFDVSVATLANQSLNYLVSGNIPERLGGAHPNIVPYQTFKASDSYWILAVGNDDQFRKFCHAADCLHLANDDRFANNQSRVMHRDILVPELETIINKQTRQWWLEKLEAVGVPCGPINDIAEAFAEPQAQARQLRREIATAKNEAMPTVAQPIQLSKSQVAYNLPPPKLGEHNHEILSEILGLSDAEITDFKDKKIINNN